MNSPPKCDNSKRSTEEGISIIIVDGPDGAGKTTLIEQLVEDFQLLRMPRFSSSVDGPYDRLKDLVDQDNNIAPSAVQIYDRHPLLSEPIYGPLLRGTAQWGWDELAWFPRAWAQLLIKEPFFIICLPPFKTVAQNIQDSSEIQISGVSQALPGIYWSYFFLALRLQTQSPYCFLYDYTNTKGVDEYRNLQWNLVHYWRD